MYRALPFLIAVAIAAQAAWAGREVKPPGRKPASKYSCKLTSNLGDESKPLQESFDLLRTTERILPNNTKIQLDAGAESPRLSVYQYVDPGKQTYYLYQLQCDLSLNCSGSRTEKMSEDAPNVHVFRIHPGTWVTALIGNREVFQFHTVHRGFKFEFIAYKLEKDRRVGITVECRD